MRDLAYLDAGAGSMLLQAILGGAAGLAVMGKVLGARIKQIVFFWRRPDTDTASRDADRSATPPGV